VPWRGADGCPPAHRLLSRESPSGALKAVLRKVPGKEKEKQFLEVRRELGGGPDPRWGSGVDPCHGSRTPHHPRLQVWDQNRKVKSINLTALDKHGGVYDDGEGPGGAGGRGVLGGRGGRRLTRPCRPVWLPGLVTLGDPPALRGGEEASQGRVLLPEQGP